MQNEPMLCVQDLSVRFKTKYGSAAAVNHVSFSLKKGEKLGLVGESGSGKSVTSKSIIRLLPTPPAQITGNIAVDLRNRPALCGGMKVKPHQPYMFLRG